MNDYFNFAESKEKQNREAEASKTSRRRLAVHFSARGGGMTSEKEYEVDALAHSADEGRGDRRNVQGELHASDEP